MNKPLGFGIALAGISFGWMVGASGSPIAATVFPVVFALVVTVFSFLRGGNDGAAWDKAFANEHPPEKVIEELRTLLEMKSAHSAQVGRMLGWALLCFFTLYMGGMIVGAAARIQGWFDTSNKTRSVPWANQSPANQGEAVEKIKLAENLYRLGYSTQAVQDILALPPNTPPGEVTARSIPEPWDDGKSAPATVQEAIYLLGIAHRFEAMGYDQRFINFILSLPVGSAVVGGAMPDGDQGQTDNQTPQGTSDPWIFQDPQHRIYNPRIVPPASPIVKPRPWDPVILPDNSIRSYPSDRLKDVEPFDSRGPIFEQRNR